MVVPPTPIIPGDDYRSVPPIGAVANRIDNRGYPGGAATVVREGVIGILTIGDDQGHLRELIVSARGTHLAAALKTVDRSMRDRVGLPAMRQEFAYAAHRVGR